MNPSSTLISDLRNAIYKDDEDKFRAMMDSVKEPEFKSVIVNLREAVIDFFVFQVNPEKVNTPEMFDIAKTAIKDKYSKAMLTLLMR